MSLKIINLGEGFEYEFFGSVSGTEVIQARSLIYSSTDKLTKYYLFNHYQCTEYNVTHNEIALIAELDIQAAQTNPKIIMAIIESKHLDFSLTEAWHAHVENHIHQISSFSDRNPALNWIKSIIE